MLPHLLLGILVFLQLPLRANCSLTYKKLTQVKKNHEYKNFQGTGYFYLEGKRYEIEIMPTKRTTGSPPAFEPHIYDTAEVYLNGKTQAVIALREKLEVIFEYPGTNRSSIFVNKSDRKGYLDLNIRRYSKGNTYKEVKIDSKNNKHYVKEQIAQKTQERLMMLVEQLKEKLYESPLYNQIYGISYINPRVPGFEEGVLYFRLKTIGKKDTLKVAEELGIPKSYYGFPVVLRDLKNRVDY